MPLRNRTWRPVETRLVAEYLAWRWPHVKTQQRVRLGRVPHELPREGLSPEEVRMLGVWRRWADAVVLGPRETTIIEAGIIPDPGDASKLEHYMDLFPETPEFADRARLPLRGHLLYAVDDPLLHRLALRHGLTMEVWTPAWVWPYLATRRPGHRRAPLDTAPSARPAKPRTSPSGGA